MKDDRTPYGCNSLREPKRMKQGEKMKVQDGWNSDGTARYIELTYVMSEGCRYDRPAQDPQCDGCENKPKRDFNV